MYITCPSCSTSYEVDGTQIGPQGRAVRCFNCHHSWQQYPVAAQPPRMAAQSPRYVPQSQQGYAQQNYAPAYAEAPRLPDYDRGSDYNRGYAQPQQAYAPPPAYARTPQRAYEPEPTYEPEPMPEPPARPVRPEPPVREPVKAAPPPPPKPAPKPAPEPAPIMADEELPSDDELDKMLGPNRDDAASRAFGGKAIEDVPTIDEEKIAKLPDPEPLRPVYGGKAADDDDDDLLEDIEPDDIPDPDPIPAVYSGDDDDEDEDEDEKGGGLRMLIAPVVTIVALGVIAAGIFLAREPIVKFWPSANDYIYDLVGLHVMVPGEGLKRELTRTAMETVAEIDYVTATGLITNISDKEQPLPLVIVQLIDANEKVLSSKSMKLDKASLQPGEVFQFKAVFDGAPATARKVRTEWGGFADTAPAAPEAGK